MLFQQTFFERFLIVTILQTWPIIYFSIFAAQVFRRPKNNLIITLGLFFALNAIAYFISLISILSIIIYSPIAFLSYVISYYLFVFTPGILVVFSYMFLLLDKKMQYAKFNAIIIFYGILSSFVIWLGYILGEMQLNPSTNWRPIFSWIFFIITLFYVILFLVIPEIIIGIKLRKLFKAKSIKKRIRMFLISAFSYFFIISATTLYNTWIDNVLYRAILPFINAIVGTAAAYLLYQSFGRAIQKKENEYS